VFRGKDVCKHVGGVGSDQRLAMWRQSGTFLQVISCLHCLLKAHKLFFKITSMVLEQEHIFNKTSNYPITTLTLSRYKQVKWKHNYTILENNH